MQNYNGFGIDSNITNFTVFCKQGLRFPDRWFPAFIGVVTNVLNGKLELQLKLPHLGVMALT
ncbi:MAG TPA: hypothetical protein DCO83_17770 [Mucilaginibacter sp.]|nr:hypothetical protein [Mucilaginibacter sp.]